jgi:alkanesulfonate monooxygenase SsuD/methylene tetrahydromethanopterin reductase-like flavin-dependent oxidoreductase (luciferase family)
VLLAKEAASIDGISGGRLTLGLGLGVRPDDFTVDGRGVTNRGRTMDSDLEIYHEVWNGGRIAGGPNQAVPAGTRPVPLMFGGHTASALARMAKWGQGYIETSMYLNSISDAFDNARAAWQQAGRNGSPRLIATREFALGDGDLGRTNIYDYCSGSPRMAKAVSARVATTVNEIQQIVEAVTAFGADEIIFNPATDDPDDIERLAEIVF